MYTVTSPNEKFEYSYLLIVWGWRRDQQYVLNQGSHRLEKYLNIQDCLEKSLKIKFVLESTGKTIKGLEKSLNFTIYRSIQHCLWRAKSV